jgi:mono/diheme cytochrome c family protein
MNRMTIIGALIAAAPQIALAQAADLDEGKAIAEANCSRCHAVGEQGDSPMPAAPPFRTIPDRYDPNDLTEALAEGMVVGHDAMPQFELPPEKISNLLAYIASLKGKP